MLQKFRNWWTAPLTYKRLYRDTLVCTLAGMSVLAGWLLWVAEANKEAQEAEEEAAEYDRLYEKLVNGKEDEP